MSKKNGFTLLELLISISILAMVFGTCYFAFSGALNAWRRGSEYLEKQHHNDFIQEQIFSALRSTAFVESEQLDYGLHHTDREINGIPSDEISWITSSPAFAREPLTFATHRISLTIDNDGEEPALAAKLYFHFADEDKIEQTEYQPVSQEIIGLNCRFYNSLNEEWEDEWTSSNQVPREVEITLYAPSADEDTDPLAFTRLIEIPVADPTQESRSSDK